MKLACLLVLCLAVTACGTMHFVKPGGGETELQRDWTNCEAKAGAAGYYGALPGRSFMERCMIGEGWERTD